ncbi:MAG TPA: response regulator [Edaphobacter sp.]|nr:response regulator [Edaphobacter sp.]
MPEEYGISTPPVAPPARPKEGIIRILLVDDDELIRYALSALLKEEGFDVTTSDSPADALKLISSEIFDVLLSDLHMPGLGDGLTVVSAMRHANPKAVTILLSAFPEMTAATQAILLQADQILVKPMDIATLVATIKQRLASEVIPARTIESVASILERSTPTIIEEWYDRIEESKKLTIVGMTREQRTSHIPKILIDLVVRLRSFQPLGSMTLVSVAAQQHGTLRCQQGYSSAMLVEESRMLQVSIFHTLQKNLGNIDFSVLLTEVMAIADEVDAQLSQATDSYSAEVARQALPV